MILTHDKILFTLKMKTSKIDLIILLALLVLIFPKNAHAYLDPGTGSYVLQVAAALLFGGLFAVKAFWSHIKAFFSSMFGKGKNSEKGKHHNE